MSNQGKKRCPKCGRYSRCKCGPFLPSVDSPPNHPMAESRCISSKLSAFKQQEPNGPQPPHLVVIARAGTGKTTTLIEGLKRIRGLPVSITPSPQQGAVWAEMGKSRNARTVCFVAFNKSIAGELQKRVPPGCYAMTMHSMGYKAVLKAFPGCRVGSYRVQDIISELLGADIHELRRREPTLIQATERLVGLCKMNLIQDEYPLEGEAEDGPETLTCLWWDERLSALAAQYDVDLNGMQHRVFALVPRVLERCKDVQHDGCCDFADMIWLPIALNLPLFRYDLLLVDEAQDLNRCQQALARKAGRRLILCGDPKQAIYGFAGADAESMPRMEQELRATSEGCVVLPLTVTRRCGKAIVAEARQYVPNFEAHADNLQGVIGGLSIGTDPKSDYRVAVQDGDMILCRVNVLLVSECFRFLRQGRKAQIQGRDVGQGLVSIVRKLCKPLEPEQVSLVTLIQSLGAWLAQETAKENAKRFPSEAKMIALQDRYDCILAFTEEQETVDGVIAKIEAIFTDDKNGTGIRLSSIHKAKGLEARRVFFLRTKDAPCPHPMAKTVAAREQEFNLCYVAITRAIEELVYVG